MRFLNVSVILVEVNRACLTGCKGCYMEHAAASSRAISFDEFKKRIAWVKKWTTATKIILIGGEPLLYPLLEKAVLYCRRNGLSVGVITSLKVGESPVGKKNWQFILAEFMKGRLDLEVSFQAGLNEEEYRKFSQFLIQNAKGTMAISSTIVVDDAKEYPLLWEKLFFTWAGSLNSQIFTNGKEQNFSESGGGISIYFILNTEKASVTITTRFVQRMGFSPFSKKFGACPVDRIVAGEGSISINSLYITSTGEVTFPQPQCIVYQIGFLNIDQKPLYERIVASCEAKIRHIHEADSKRRKNGWTEPKTGCYCPFNGDDGICKNCSEGWQ